MTLTIASLTNSDCYYFGGCEHLSFSVLQFISYAPSFSARRCSSASRSIGTACQRFVHAILCQFVFDQIWIRFLKGATVRRFRSPPVSAITAIGLAVLDLGLRRGFVTLKK